MFVVSTIWRIALRKEMAYFQHIANVSCDLTLRTMHVKPPLKRRLVKYFVKNDTPYQQLPIKYKFTEKIFPSNILYHPQNPLLTRTRRHPPLDQERRKPVLTPLHLHKIRFLQRHKTNEAAIL